MINKKDYQDCLNYIDTYWERIIHKPGKQRIRDKIITIPHAFVTPNDKKFSYIYYWDSYFIFRGLMDTKREWVMRDMVNNFCFLLNTYGFIPNFNSPASMGRSQPPFLSSMIFDVYNNLIIHKGLRGKMTKTLSYLYKPMSPKRWLKKMISTAKNEYESVWIDKENVHHHSVPNVNLSKYGDLDIGYAHSSELESGWDFTSRFYNRCNEFLPIDLNTFLYKYENDFAHAAKILNDPIDEAFWLYRMDKRRTDITSLMWNNSQGFFFDYDFIHKKQSSFLSLAGFTPLWAGFATPAQARKMVKKLPQFESDYGLIITDQNSLAKPTSRDKRLGDYAYAIDNVLKPKQWDFPNIWPPLEYLTVIGLLRYGYITDATRIMKKSVKAQSHVFRKNKTLFEKINGMTGNTTNNFHYKVQSGFGWTNAIFYRYTKILAAIESGQDIYHGQRKTPPFAFNIPH